MTIKKNHRKFNDGMIGSLSASSKKKSSSSKKREKEEGFRIKIHDSSVILKYDSDFLSLSFHPTDPESLTDDGYNSGESGEECGFYICKDKNTICFYAEGQNGTLNLTLKFTEEIMKSYYNSIEEWRKYIVKSANEEIFKIVNAINSGLHPSYLDESEKQILQEKLGVKWYEEFGYERGDLSR